MADVLRIAFSYREQPVGGGISAQPKISDENALRQAQHLVLLIHGYNNDAQAAKQAYDGFHARQRDLAGGTRYGIGLTFVELYWPGDAAWGFASFLFYMASIRRALQTAAQLAAYLTANMVQPARIDIVAHSMGCRLATELLRALQDRPTTPPIERIVFMAGAIPTFMLERRDPPRRLRPCYDSVLRDGARSLYSGADMVLALAFPAGQSLAPGEEGFLPSALGHALWTDRTVPDNLGQQQNPGAGHGDYWGWNTRPGPLRCAINAAQEVRSYLQFPSAGSRAIAERPLAQSTAPDARKVEAPRAIVARNTPAYA